MNGAVRAVLLVETYSTGGRLKRDPPVPAGSIGVARPLYPGARLLLFELPTGVRLVVPLTDVRELAPD